MDVPDEILPIPAPAPDEDVTDNSSGEDFVESKCIGRSKHRAVKNQPTLVYKPRRSDRIRKIMDERIFNKRLQAQIKKNQEQMKLEQEMAALAAMVNMPK